MPSSPGSILVDPNGQTAVVTFTLPGGGTPIAYDTRSNASTISLPATITVPTRFYFVEQTQFGVSVLVGGTQVATAAGTVATVDLSGGGMGQVTARVPSTSGSSSASTLLGITESFVPITTAGTATQQFFAVTFVSDGTPVTIEASGGAYTCTGAQAMTWDLYDAVTAKVLRQVIRTSAAATVADDIPFLRRSSVTFTVGPQTVFLRWKPTGNTGITMNNQPATATDESPLQLTVRKAA